MKYNWRVLQLLPTPDHASYAGAQVEVQQRLDGSLVVRYQGRFIPTQEAPPRLTALRSLNRSQSGSTPGKECLARGVSPNGAQGHIWLEVLGSLSERAAAGSLDDACNTGDGRRQALPRRQPTPRQRARWEAVQEAKRQGLPLRAIARKLGLARKTVRKYVALGSPPVYPVRRSRGNGSKKKGELTKSLNT